METTALCMARSTTTLHRQKMVQLTVQLTLRHGCCAPTDPQHAFSRTECGRALWMEWRRSRSSTKFVRGAHAPVGGAEALQLVRRKYDGAAVAPEESEDALLEDVV